MELLSAPITDFVTIPEENALPYLPIPTGKIPVQLQLRSYPIREQEGLCGLARRA